MNFLTKNIKITASAVFIFVIAAFIVFSDYSKPARESFFAFDTDITLEIYGRNAKAAAQAVKEYISGLESEISMHNKSGFAARFNALNVGERLEMSENVKQLILESVKMSEQTGGCFDITTAALSQAWDVKNRTSPPTDAEIAAALEKTGTSRLNVSGDFLIKTDAQIDFGGIAKGYASDKIRGILESRGIKKAVINLGGNVSVIGKKAKNKDFTVGVTDPFNPSDVSLTVNVSDTNIITSGAYQRFFEYGGKRYHHIISPFDGYPAQSDVESVTVISKNGTQADALSTAVFVAGSEKGMEYVKKLGAGAVIITKNGEILECGGVKYEKK